MTKLIETELRKFINNCPKCGEELKPYSPLPGMCPVSAYCPSCDILRMNSMSPLLCVNCHSTRFYNDDREMASKIDSLITDKLHQLYDTKNVFTKGFVYRDDVSKEERNVLLEDVKKLQEQRPKDICWYCGETRFVGLKSEKVYEMERKGELKIGYKISSSFVPVRHDCEYDNGCNDILIRVANTVFRATCKCGYEEYVLVPEWQQEEIKEIKDMKMSKGGKEGKCDNDKWNNDEDENSLDKLTIEDLDMTQKIPIITFSDDKDLLEKVKKAVSRYEDT